MRVRKPFNVTKAHRRYSKLLLIIKQVGQSTYLLSDSKKWHSSQLVRYHTPAFQETLASSVPHAVSDDFTVLEPDLTDAMDSHATSARVRRHPSWFENYVT